MSTPDSGGGMPDAMASEHVSLSTEAYVLIGDNPSGGEDPIVVSS